VALQQPDVIVKALYLVVRRGVTGASLVATPVKPYRGAEPGVAGPLHVEGQRIADVPGLLLRASRSAAASYGRPSQ
jgi:hypothetical protein